MSTNRDVKLPIETADLLVDVLTRIETIWDREGFGSDEAESEPLYARMKIALTMLRNHTNQAKPAADTQGNDGRLDATIRAKYDGGTNPREIAEELGIDRREVSQALKRTVGIRPLWRRGGY